MKRQLFAFRSLATLARDIRGNTLAIVAAALIPLTAMIGSGVDMSRAYMAKTRLQSACDAAALAGRRVMQNDTLDANVTAEAVRFFNFNFNQGLYGTAAFTPAVTRPSAGTVRVTASTTIPTTIMQMFGFATLPLDVTCDGSLNFVSTDIMLVLDTTGSMADDINGNSTNAASQQKIFALREAVMALYDELAPVQTQLEANGMRMRYGVVPYSSTVNVGTLIRDASPSYLADSVDYETRIGNFTTTSTGTTATTTTSVEIYPTSISRSNCKKYGQNNNFSGFAPSAESGGGPAPADTWTRSYQNDESNGVDYGWPGAPDTSGSTRSCRRHVTTVTTSYQQGYQFTNATYRRATFDTSQFKLGNDVEIASGDGGRMAASGSYTVQQLAASGDDVPTTTTRWNGCIMERDTVSTITSSSGLTIPSGAYDLDINLIPSSDATRWRPQWPEVTHYRSSISSLTSSQQAVGAPLTNYTSQQVMACPTEARRLTTTNRGQLQSYMNTLDPDGYTYHDIGMIWGARMISSAGIFADSPSTFNGMPVTRHIIFMTDGMLNTNSRVYGAYGVEGMEQRVAGPGGGSTLTDRHRQRFRMICNAAKANGASIWVVAFATTLDASLIECASNPNQAFLAANRDQLIQQFRLIASNIGALRLTQ